MCFRLSSAPKYYCFSRKLPGKSRLSPLIPWSLHSIPYDNILQHKTAQPQGPQDLFWLCIHKTINHNKSPLSFQFCRNEFNLCGEQPIKFQQRKRVFLSVSDRWVGIILETSWAKVCVKLNHSSMGRQITGISQEGEEGRTQMLLDAG